MTAISAPQVKSVNREAVRAQVRLTALPLTVSAQSVFATQAQAVAKLKLPMKEIFAMTALSAQQEKPANQEAARAPLLRTALF